MIIGPLYREDGKSFFHGKKQVGREDIDRVLNDQMGILLSNGYDISIFNWKNKYKWDLKVDHERKMVYLIDSEDEFRFLQFPHINDYEPGGSPTRIALGFERIKEISDCKTWGDYDELYTDKQESKSEIKKKWGQASVNLDRKEKELKEIVKQIGKINDTAGPGSRKAVSAYVKEFEECWEQMRSFHGDVCGWCKAIGKVGNLWHGGSINAEGKFYIEC